MSEAVVDLSFLHQYADAVPEQVKAMIQPGQVYLNGQIGPVHFVATSDIDGHVEVSFSMRDRAPSDRTVKALLAHLISDGDRKVKVLETKGHRNRAMRHFVLRKGAVQ